jgi:hypothetical protein
MLYRLLRLVRWVKKLENAVAPQEHRRAGPVVRLWQQAMLRLARILRRLLNKLQGNWYRRHWAERHLPWQQLPAALSPSVGARLECHRPAKIKMIPPFPRVLRVTG